MCSASQPVSEPVVPQHVSGLVSFRVVSSVTLALCVHTQPLACTRSPPSAILSCAMSAQVHCNRNHGRKALAAHGTAPQRTAAQRSALPRCPISASSLPDRAVCVMCLAVTAALVQWSRPPHWHCYEEAVLRGAVCAPIGPTVERALHDTAWRGPAADWPRRQTPFESTAWKGGDTNKHGSSGCSGHRCDAMRCDD